MRGEKEKKEKKKKKKTHINPVQAKTGERDLTGVVMMWRKEQSKLGQWSLGGG